MADPELQKHQRVNDILLGPLERKTLAWLCPRMPPWVTPDVLTLLALAAGILIAASYALTNYSDDFLWLASFGFVVHWFGDSLDGTLARFRKIERPRYGYFVDHSLDSFTEFLIGLGIGLSPFVRLDIALFAISGYLLMSISVYIRTYITGVFQISYGKFGPTEVRIAVIIANTLIYFTDNPGMHTGYGHFTLFDAIALSIGIILLTIFLFTTFRIARELARQEPPHPGV